MSGPGEDHLVVRAHRYSVECNEYIIHFYNMMTSSNHFNAQSYCVHVLLLLNISTVASTFRISSNPCEKYNDILLNFVF